MTGTTFPQYIAARPDPANQRTFDQFVTGMTDAGRRGAQGMTGALAGVRDTVAQALSLPRNAGGSLDLQIDQLRQMERELEAVARATQEYAQASRAAAIASGENGRARTQEIRAAFELARVEQGNLAALRQRITILDQVQAELNQTASATDAVVAATRRGTDAYGIHNTSLRGSRVAMVQTGQQLQDMAIQFQSGTRSSVIFAQQIPQLLFALTSLEGSSNKTADKIGRFATLMSGPWSLAVVAGAALLGSLIDNLFRSGDAADSAADKTKALAKALTDLRTGLDLNAKSYKVVVEAIREYNDAQSKSKELTLGALELTRADTLERLKNAKAIAAQFQARFLEQSAASKGGGEVKGALGAQATTAQKQVEAILASIRDIEKGIANRQVEGVFDKEIAVTDKYADALAKLERRYDKGKVAVAEYRKERERLLGLQEAELKAIRESEKKTREVTGLAQFINPVAGGTVTGRFNEQRPGHRHGGLDLAAPTGTAVKAPQIGVVEAVGFSPTLGKYVVIDHGGGTKTRFGHLSDNAVVSEGARVEQGQTIGKVGSTGRSTGPHLHYEVTVNGKKVDPSKGLFPVDDVKVNEAAERAVERAKQAAEQLQAFGERSAESIARINERFDEQPRLIDAANAATRDLDKTIAELAERKPPGFADMIAEAQAAKATIQEALVRPFEELAEASERRLQIETLITAGREDEAQALETIWRLEDTIGDLTDERKAAILDLVRSERLHSEELERKRAIIGEYLSATRSVKDELVSIFSGEGSIGNIGKIFKRLQAQITVERLFGDSFRKIDEWLKGQSGLGASVDYFSTETERAGKSASSAADEFARTVAKLRSIPAGPVAPGSAPSAFDAAFGSIYGGAANDNSSAIEDALGEGFADITVYAARQAKALDAIDRRLDPAVWANATARAMAAPIADLLKPLLGDKFAGKIGSVLSGVIEGKITAGTTGAVLGGLRDVFGGAGNGGIGDFVFGPALGGAQTGTQISQLMDSFGIGNSTTGAQIGGALGSAVGGPAGSIIGSIIGSIVGSIFKSAKRGSATLTAGPDGVEVGSTRGNSRSRIEAAENAGDSISEALNRIAEQLGGAADGPLSVSIGVRDGNYRVDPTGQGITKTANGAIDFGKDQEAAIRFAILDAIKDGVLTGISQGAQKLLQSGKDLERQVQKALDFEGVFKRLRAIKDPVGAAIDDLEKEFTRLNDIFKEAGASAAEFAQLEELYGLERAQAIKEAGERLTGALKALLADLTIGNDALSLRDRLAAAQAAYQPLASRVAAGDTTAFDDYAQAARDLIAIQRDLSGSTPDYFALLEEVTALTRTTLAAQDALIAASSGGAGPFADAAVTPANDNTQVVATIAAQTDTLAAGIAATNQNLGTLIELTAVGLRSAGTLTTISTDSFAAVGFSRTGGY
jgi:murein DD-endopeptidase MepM/ murein hydrolase activator NlpD